MSDGTWDQIQEIKIKRNSLREKLEKRKKERQGILLGSTDLVAASSFIKSESSGSEDKKPVLSNIKHEIGKRRRTISFLYTQIRQQKFHFTRRGPRGGASIATNSVG